MKRLFLLTAIILGVALWLRAPALLLKNLGMLSLSRVAVSEQDEPAWAVRAADLLQGALRLDPALPRVATARRWLERSPYLHRGYARFCLSLPSELLRKRKLQIEMLDKYWPQVSKIGGTSRLPHGIARMWHGVRCRVARWLARSLRPLMGVTWLNKMGLDCAAARKWDAFFPVSRNLANMGPFRARPILEAAERAISGSQEDLVKVMAVQSVVFRLLNETQLEAL